MVDTAVLLKQAIFSAGVVAAVVAGAIALISLLANYRLALKVHRQRLGHERELAQARQNAETDLAQLKLREDRRSAWLARRALNAEGLLAALYEFAHAFRAIRSPLVLAAEMATEDGVADDIATHPAYAIIRRMRAHESKIVAIDAKRFAFQALFGRDSDPQFQALTRLWNSVHHAANELVRYRNNAIPEQETFLASCRRITTLGLEPDATEAGLIQVVEAFEAICRPAIEAAATADAPIGA
jgi:hypothetical protein